MGESAPHTVDKGAKIFVRTRREYPLVGSKSFGRRQLRQNEKDVGDDLREPSLSTSVR
jgi:hypothetical protein